VSLTFSGRFVWLGNHAVLVA